MKMRPANRDVLLNECRGYKKTKNQELLEEFVNGKHECVVVDEYAHSSAYSCANSLRQSIKTFRLTSIEVIVHKGKVYLLKKL